MTMCSVLQYAHSIVRDDPMDFTQVHYTVDPHISEPQLSDLPNYLNTLLMKFIGFLVHFNPLHALIIFLNHAFTREAFIEIS